MRRNACSHRACPSPAELIEHQSCVDRAQPPAHIMPMQKLTELHPGVRRQLSVREATQLTLLRLLAMSLPGCEGNGISDKNFTACPPCMPWWHCAASVVGK